jgi:hypothetical protein
MVHGVHLDAGTATPSDVSVSRHATGSLSVGVPGAPYLFDPVGLSPDPRVPSLSREDRAASECGAAPG